MGRTPITAAVIAAAAALLFSGCASSAPTTSESAPAESASAEAPATEAAPAASGTIIVGSANFTESEILGNVYAKALANAGYTIEEKFNIGSREVYIPALSDESIDLIPDYSGNLLSYLDETATAASAADINAALPAALEAKGLAMGTPAAAEDKDSIVVTAETAEKWSLTSIADLAAHNDELKLAGTPEFKERAVGLPGLEKNYGVIPVEYVAIADGGGPATVAALLDGTVHGANIYTTTPSIGENNFVVLEDPKSNFPAQSVVPVYRAGAIDATGLAVLDAVSAVLTTEDLLSMNAMVSGDQKLEPAAAAETWLKEKGLIS